MTDFVEAFYTIIDGNLFFHNLSLLIPPIGLVLIFSFTYRQIKSLIKGVSKGYFRIF